MVLKQIDLRIKVSANAYASGNSNHFAYSAAQHQNIPKQTHLCCVAVKHLWL
jgi:hypothetical protein